MSSPERNLPTWSGLSHKNGKAESSRAKSDRLEGELRRKLDRMFAGLPNAENYSKALYEKYRSESGEGRSKILSGLQASIRMSFAASDAEKIAFFEGAYLGFFDIIFRQAEKADMKNREHRDYVTKWYVFIKYQEAAGFACRTEEQRKFWGDWWKRFSRLLGFDE